LTARRRPALAAAAPWLAALLAATLGLAGLLALTPSAYADGDPASDVLLGQGVFYPYTPPVTAATEKALNGATARAAAGGFALKVALIASPVDLGVIPDLFGRPQPYAAFLDQEISFQTKQPLLVVMAAGYGVQGVPAAVTALAHTLPKPASGRSEDLARAALAAVPRLAAAAGHPLRPPRAAHTSGGRTLLLVLLAAVAAAVATALLVLRRRSGGR
jgi:hypothetical protein